jgi:hypothetical protein
LKRFFGKAEHDEARPPTEMVFNVKEAIVAWISANAQDDAANKPKPGITISVPVLLPADN